MAESLGGPTAIDTYTHTSINLAIRVDADPKTNTVRVLFVGNPGSIAMIGTDGQILGAGDVYPVAADDPITLQLNPGNARRAVSFYTEVATQPTVIKVISEG